MYDTNITAEIRTGKQFDLTALFANNGELEGGALHAVEDSPYNNLHESCGYHEPHQLTDNLKLSSKSHSSFFHLNCRGLSHNWENFVSLLNEMHTDTFSFDHIGISEAFRCDMDSRLT